MQPIDSHTCSVPAAEDGGALPLPDGSVGVGQRRQHAQLGRQPVLVEVGSTVCCRRQY